MMTPLAAKVMENEMKRNRWLNPGACRPHLRQDVRSSNLPSVKEIAEKFGISRSYAYKLRSTPLRRTA